MRSSTFYAFCEFYRTQLEMVPTHGLLAVRKALSVLVDNAVRANITVSISEPGPDFRDEPGKHYDFFVILSYPDGLIDDPIEAVSWFGLKVSGLTRLNEYQVYQH
jgi:hypothetical protein